MTLQMKELYKKPLIVLFYIKGRMDKGLKTKPVDIANETGLTRRAVYNQIEDLEKQNVVVVIRKNLKNITDIRLTPSSVKELRDQTLEFLLHESLLLKVQRLIKHHDSEIPDVKIGADLEYLLHLMKTEFEECFVAFIRQEYNTIIPDGIFDRMPVRLTETVERFLHKIKSN